MTKQPNRRARHVLSWIGPRASILAFYLVTSACSVVSEPESTRQVRQQSTLQSFNVLAPALEAGALVAATEWLEIGDRATVLDGSAWGNVTNSGTGVVRIGTDAHVG